MRMITWLLGAVTAVAASGAGAQSTAQKHEQHQASGQHQVAGQHRTAMGEKCCCEDMMREMHKMMEMMRKHQGVGMDTPKTMPMPDEKPAQ